MTERLAAPPDDRRQSGRHLVRPRLVWGGLALAVVGVVAIGLGLTVLGRPVWIGGVAALLVGAVLAWRGGILNDAGSGLRPEEEAQAVIHGDVHEGVHPGQAVESPRAQHTAAELAHQTRALQAATRSAPAPAFTPAAGWVLILACVVVIVAQWGIVAHSATGRDNSFRDTGLAIVIGLCGVRLALPTGRHHLTVAITTAAGVCFVLVAFLAAHDHTAIAVLEATVGVLVVGAALSALASPVRHPANG